MVDVERAIRCGFLVVLQNALAQLLESAEQPGKIRLGLACDQHSNKARHCDREGINEFIRGIVAGRVEPLVEEALRHGEDDAAVGTDGGLFEFLIFDAWRLSLWLTSRSGSNI